MWKALFKLNLVLLIVSACLLTKSMAQPLNKKKNFTRQDTLRGSITPERAWWDVSKYKIFVQPDF